MKLSTIIKTGFLLTSLIVMDVESGRLQDRLEQKRENRFLKDDYRENIIGRIQKRQDKTYIQYNKLYKVCVTGFINSDHVKPTANCGKHEVILVDKPSYDEALSIYQTKQEHKKQVQLKQKTENQRNQEVQFANKLAEITNKTAQQNKFQATKINSGNAEAMSVNSGNEAPKELGIGIKTNKNLINPEVFPLLGKIAIGLVGGYVVLCIISSIFLNEEERRRIDERMKQIKEERKEERKERKEERLRRLPPGVSDLSWYQDIGQDIG